MGFGAATAMQTPSLVRAEHQSAAQDLFGGVGGSTSVSRRDFVFVINPKGANGRTGKEWKKILPHLRARLGGHCNAIREGADAVISVGGDGTLS